MLRNCKKYKHCEVIIKLLPFLLQKSIAVCKFLNFNLNPREGSLVEFHPIKGLFQLSGFENLIHNVMLSFKEIKKKLLVFYI